LASLKQKGGCDEQVYYSGFFRGRHWIGSPDGSGEKRDAHEGEGMQGGGMMMGKMKEMQGRMAEMRKGMSGMLKGQGMMKGEETKDMGKMMGDMGSMMGEGKMTPEEMGSNVQDDGRHVRHDEADIGAHASRKKANKIARK
jgi:hypothetical protein